MNAVFSNTGMNMNMNGNALNSRGAIDFVAL